MGLQYQWYFRKVGQTEFSVWKNHTSDSEVCTPNATWDGIQLYCTVIDKTGASVQSDTVTVTMQQALAITRQPVNQTIVLGDSLKISLKASGMGLQYQWYFRKVGQTEFSVWKNHTSDSETCMPNATWDGIELYCTVTDKNGASVQSEIVTIKVNQN